MRILLSSVTRYLEYIKAIWNPWPPSLNLMRARVEPILGKGQSAIPESAASFLVHLVKVRVDPETGQVKPLEYLALQDVGFALNPLVVGGQIHGGVAQGSGLGLHEALHYDAQGQALSASFMEYESPESHGGSLY